MVDALQYSTTQDNKVVPFLKLVSLWLWILLVLYSSQDRAFHLCTPVNLSVQTMTTWWFTLSFILIPKPSLIDEMCLYGTVIFKYIRHCSGRPLTSWACWSLTQNW